MRDERLMAHVGIVDEGASFRIGRHISGGSILEAFDNGRLARTVCSDDGGERVVELHDGEAVWIKGAAKEGRGR